LSEHGLRLRNVARNVGDISIQDLLGEDLTQILLRLLRLGATSKSPEDWNEALRTMQFLEAVYPDDESGQQRIQNRLQNFVREQRRAMRELDPVAESAGIVARMTLDFVRVPLLRQSFPEYKRNQEIHRVRDRLVKQFDE
jgi:hypothetical protein